MKKSSKIVLTIIILIFSIYYCFLLGQNAGITFEETTSEMSSIPQTIPYECKEDSPITLTIIPRYGYLKSVRVLLINIEENATGEFVCTLSDENGQMVKTKQVALEDIDNGEWSNIILGTPVREGKPYQLTFYATGSQTNPQMLFCNDNFDVSENSHAAIAGMETGKGLVTGYVYRKTLPVYTRIILIVLLIVITIGISCCLWLPSYMQKLYQVLFEGKEIRRIPYGVCMGILIILAVFLHCYKLMDIPYGLHEDEMAIGYDAWCISAFGTDRYGNTYPVYFANYGTGQNALYIYMSAILMKLFGYKELFMRIPSVINAFLTAFFGYKIVQLKWKNRNANLIFMGLYTILPVFLQITRFGLESYLMLGFGTMFLYSLMNAVEKKKIGFWVVSGICGGILLYTYAISYPVMVLFLLFMLGYLLKVKSLSIKQFIGFAIPLALLGLPLVLCQIINMFDLPEIKFGLITITKFTSYRGSELLWNHPVETLWKSLNCILGNDTLPYNSLPQFKTMYVLSIPFILIGFFHGLYELAGCIRNKVWDITAVIMLWMIAMLCVACVIGGNGPNVNKLNGIYIACIFCLVDGILLAIQAACQLNWMKAIMGCSFIAYILLSLHFVNFYFREYNDNYYPRYDTMVFADSYTEVFAYIHQNMDQQFLRKTFYIDEDMPIFFLGSTLTSPQEYDFATYENHYQNYHFYLPDEIDWTANYIVKESDIEYAMALEQGGYSITKINRWFLCYPGIS